MMFPQIAFCQEYFEHLWHCKLDATLLQSNWKSESEILSLSSEDDSFPDVKSHTKGLLTGQVSVVKSTCMMSTFFQKEICSVGNIGLPRL